jgi:hypothetical protein
VKVEQTVTKRNFNLPKQPAKGFVEVRGVTNIAEE